MIGNPTNPTSVLHPAGSSAGWSGPAGWSWSTRRSWTRCPGRAESMIGGAMPGLIVLRSLTKTWGLAGLRAGYAVGDERIIAGMRAQQPPWSVSTPGAGGDGRLPVAGGTARSPIGRPPRSAGTARTCSIDWSTVGLPAAGSPQAPFVLVDTTPVRGNHPAGWLRLALRDHGFAVRRGETFPGLDADWIRIAVRDQETTDRLSAALRRLVRL